MVTGTTTNAVDGSAVQGISFTVSGTLLGASGANGTFAVGFPAAGTNRASLAATGFVTRETGVTAPGGPVTISLIPTSFDLTAFDQMFRHSSSGLTRWRSAPGLVLERRVVQFTQVCAQSYQAIDDLITGSEADSILTDMRDGYTMLTDGRLGGLASVEQQTADAGATVVPRVSGKIVVMRGAGLTTATGFWGYACWSTTGDGEVTGGFIIVDRDFDKSTSPSLAPFHRSLRMHELGHTLGCQHVSGRTSVMNSNARTEPNDFDRQSARVASLRPTGNRTPDIDPSTHIATTAGRARQTLTWHGAH
jgi:hypothetical protein